MGMTRYQAVSQPAKAQGFTLIELIMVIVILGILSAFALPKFADFTGDAETSSIEGAKGTVRSASAIAHAACLATDSCNASGATSSVQLEGVSVAMVYGYPSVAGIQDASALDGYAISTGGTPELIIAVNGSAGSPCFTYSVATEADGVISAPAISALGTVSDADGSFPSADDDCN